MFNSKKFLPKILTSFLFLAIIVVGIFSNKFSKASADTNLPVSGYAWSDNIGWIHFNPAFGGVFYGKDTGQFSGYAWSDNIGWIYFGPDKSNISALTAPNEPRQWAKADTTTGIVNGWAKTYRAIPDKTDINAEDDQTLGGWEGWIKMDHGMSNPVSVDFVTGDFHGWAWGSDTAGIVGWISFNSKDCDLDNNGFIDIACGGNNNNTTPAYPYKVTIGASDVITPTYTIEPSTASVSVGGTQRFIGWYDSDGSGSAIRTDKTLEASYWSSSNTAIATIATNTGQTIVTCKVAGIVSILSAYGGVAATPASLTCTTVAGPLCGNGVKESGEQCDDGNTNNGDGCSSSCTIEGGGGTGGGGGTTGGGGTSTTTIGGGGGTIGGGGNNKEVGAITITPSLSTIKAIIIEGLPANSETTTLTIGGSCAGGITLTANYIDGATNRGTFSFLPFSVASGGAPEFSVKNIPGNTEAKTYPIEIKGTASGCSDGVRTVNLKVERTGSTWQEF